MVVNLQKIVQVNLEVAKAYLDQNKYDQINVIGNRILQDLYSMNERDLMAIGLILKEISFDLQQIRALSKGKPGGPVKKGSLKAILSEDLKNSLPFAKACLQTLIDGQNNTYLPIDSWQAYIKFEDGIRKYLTAPEERDFYFENPEFSKAASIHYLKFLLANEGLLLKMSRMPIERSRAELALIINLRGGNVPMISYLITRSFEHAARFAIFGKIDDDEYSAFIASNLRFIGEIINSIEIDDETAVIEKANKMVGDLMYEYRDYFVRFGEISTDLAEQVPLSPDAAEKIQKIIEKHQG